MLSNFYCRLVTQEREAKRQYKEAFEALAKARTKMEASAKQEEGLRRDLIDSFDGYLEAKVGAATSPANVPRVIYF